MTEKEFDEIWAPVKSVIDYCNLQYDEAVTLGGQFGKLKSIILEQEEKIKNLQSAADKYYRLEAYGVDNWSWYSEAINDVDGIFGEEEE
jgi:hypothetical protein